MYFVLNYFYIIRKIINLESPKKKRHEVIFDELSCTGVMKKRQETDSNLT